jgi:phospholipid/cholesterol/gamma-HCH transport system substrate-binding protein
MERRWLEISVGVFLIIGMACLAYLTIKLGRVGLFGGSDYAVTAVFPTVSGLKGKAGVNMAGVNIGQVEKIELKDGQAQVTMRIRQDVQLEEDSIASIKTMGIIGDKYVSITPGASDTYIKPGGAIRETQPPIDIENLVSKYIFGSVESKQKQEGQQQPQPGGSAPAGPLK